MVDFKAFQVGDHEPTRLVKWPPYPMMWLTRQKLVTWSQVRQTAFFG